MCIRDRAHTAPTRTKTAAAMKKTSVPSTKHFKNEGRVFSCVIKNLRNTFTKRYCGGFVSITYFSLALTSTLLIAFLSMRIRQ